MLLKFKKHIEAHFPFLKQARILVAISGGVDSVVLTHLLQKSKFSIGLAHVNFQLRGLESDTDETFIKSLAKKHQYPFFIHTADTIRYAKEHKKSIQMAAREIRYKWFDKLLKETRYDYLLTAHHLDDDIETFFINLSRSTGIEGLTGIPPQQVKILRPLLPFSRVEIENYARTNQIVWREDASNASTKYLRNKLRHKLLPVLKEVFPEFDASFLATQHYLKDSQKLVKSYIKLLKPTLWEEKNGRVYLSVSKLKSLPDTKAVLYELLKEYGFTEWNDICHLIAAQSGKQIYSARYRLVKDRDFLILVVHDETLVEEPLLKYQNISALALKKSQFTNINEAYLDKAKIQTPFLVRKWKQGDYFYPLGMQGKKKVSDFLIDQKISALEKEKIYLLCDAKDNIIWIIGKRLDDRYKVTDNTSEIIKVTQHENTTKHHEPFFD